MPPTASSTAEFVSVPFQVSALVISIGRVYVAYLSPVAQKPLLTLNVISSPALGTSVMSFAGMLKPAEPSVFSFQFSSLEVLFPVDVASSNVHPVSVRSASSLGVTAMWSPTRTFSSLL